MIGRDAAGDDARGVVDASERDERGSEHVWVLLDGGGYVQGDAATEWEALLDG